jgi:hypothetical protein
MLPLCFKDGSRDALVQCCQRLLVCFNALQMLGLVVALWRQTSTVCRCCQQSSRKHSGCAHLCRSAGPGASSTTKAQNCAATTCQRCAGSPEAAILLQLTFNSDFQGSQ